MYKVAVVFLLALLSAACQTQSEKAQTEKWDSFRCLHLRDQVPVTRQSAAYIRDRSESGDGLCTTILGQMYERGLGVTVDLDKARATYLVAAKLDRSAYVQLARLAEEGIGEPVDPAKARRLYEQSGAHENNKLAAVRLAKLLEDGVGGPEDKSGALNLYLKSLDRYNDDAWKGVQRLRDPSTIHDAGKVSRYNALWSRGLKNTLSRHMRHANSKFLKDFKKQPNLAPVKLEFEFSAGSLAPTVTILKGSGNSVFDDAVLTEMNLYRFPDEPILPAEQKTWKVNSEFGRDMW